MNDAKAEDSEFLRFIPILKREAGERNRYQNIIGRNVKMQAVYDLFLRRVAEGRGVPVEAIASVDSRMASGRPPVWIGMSGGVPSALACSTSAACGRTMRARRIGTCRTSVTSAWRPIRPRKPGSSPSSPP